MCHTVTLGDQLSFFVFSLGTHKQPEQHCKIRILDVTKEKLFGLYKCFASLQANWLKFNCNLNSEASY